MLDLLTFLMPPIIACVISAFLFGYFGLHVLLRGVVFVDIALAQVAALGTLTGMLCGIDRESALLTLVALLAVTLASLLFATLNFTSDGLPQEGLIGVVYCLALSACLFLAEFIPDGSGLVKESLTGSLLWVSWSNIVRLGLVGSLVGAFHIVYRRRFLKLDIAGSGIASEKGRIWEFMFYFSLGLVIVEAVEMLGVFLVFSLLVVPAAVSLLFVKRWIPRLAVAWIVGIFASLAGILSADAWNLPTAPSIVVILGTILILASICGAVLAKSPLKAFASFNDANGKAREDR